MSRWRRSESGEGRVGGLFDPIPRCGSSRALALISAHGYLIPMALLLVFVVVVLVGHPHVDLLESAFGKPTSAPGGSGNSAQATKNLYTDINALSTDAAYILVPSVTLAGAVGAIFWALGSRRGPAIVGGAIVAGVIGVGLKVIVE